jgi:hypothetical protein
VTMVCPWGRKVIDFLRPPKPKRELIAFFNEHGVAQGFTSAVDGLFAAAGDRMHSFQHMSNRPMPAEAGGDPYQLSTRLTFLSQYRFVLVVEATEEDDWMEPFLSQVFLAGAVPVYLGAPNVLQYTPGPRSMVHMRDWSDPAQLWQYLQSFHPPPGADDATAAAVEARYDEFFAWKQPAMATFMEDERGESPASLGTGYGVKAHGGDDHAHTLTADLQAWAARPDARSLADAKAALEASGASAAALGFPDVAKQAWRHYRAQMDRCVHYAECRICEYVTLMTE